MKAFDGVKIFVAIVLLGASTNILAKAPRPERSFEDKYVKQFVYSMDHSVPAVVESSLFVVLQLKNQYPNENYNEIIEKLDNLANSGPTLSIKYKAQLARLFFTNYSYFKGINTSSKNGADEVFKKIAEKIENNTIAVN